MPLVLLRVPPVMMKVRFELKAALAPILSAALPSVAVPERAPAALRLSVPPLRAKVFAVLARELPLEFWDSAALRVTIVPAPISVMAKGELPPLRREPV